MSLNEDGILSFAIDPGFATGFPVDREFLTVDVFHMAMFIALRLRAGHNINAGEPLLAPSKDTAGEWIYALGFFGHLSLCVTGEIS